jgi:hypothetical protein
MSGGAIVPLIVAAKKARERQEEERMVTYSKDDLNGWEFKIVRSATGRFRNYETLQEVIREEAKSGWELVEKFDDNRVRFKRRTERRASDQSAGIDPYRTSVGIGEGSLAAVIVAIVIGLALVGVLLAFAISGSPVISEPAGPIAAVLILMAIVLLVVKRRR